MKKRDYRAEAIEQLGDNMRLYVDNMKTRKAEQDAFDALQKAGEGRGMTKAARTALAVYGVYRWALLSNERLLLTKTDSYAVSASRAAEVETAEAQAAIAELLHTLAEAFQREVDAVRAMRLSATEAAWLRVRITKCKRDTKAGATKYPSQAEIAKKLSVHRQDIYRLEQRMHARKDVLAFLETKSIPERTRRGVTKGKKSGKG